MNEIREQFIVYLSGTMAQENEQHRTWRSHAVDLLSKHGIFTRNPYRGRDASKIIKVDNYHYTYSTAPVRNRLGNVLVARDLKDVEDSDLLLCNLRGTKGERPSIGTLSELAWAYLLRKPVICIVDKEDTDKNYYKHPFMHTFIDQWVSNVEEGVDAIINYWHPQAAEAAEGY